jgi:AAA domain
LHVNSGRKQPCVIAEMRGGSPFILRPMVDNILREIEEQQIDVISIDPFVSCHRLGENDNGAIDAVVKEWGMVAERGRCAVDLTHHTRKLGGGEVNAESSRGAKALVDGCRSVRVLNRMSEEEGGRAGIDNHRLYFRAMADKVNLAPPAERADWFRLISVDLENGPPGQSDLVGVVVSWKWPDALDGVSARDLFAIQKRISQGEWRESSQSPEWAGKAVAEVLDLDLSRAPPLGRVKSLLKTWIGSGALEVVERPDASRQKRKFIEVGEWATP